MNQSPALVFISLEKQHDSQDGKKKLTKETNVYFHPLTECVTTGKQAPHYSSFTPPTHRETLFVQAHDERS